MKKIYYLLTIIFTFSFINVFAKGDVYKIDMNIYLEENGDMRVSEVWDVKADNTTEWFKQIFNLNNQEIRDYHVSMDGMPLTYKDWNINESLSEKAGFYGKRTVDDGYELNFGVYDYNRHQFNISYTLSNAIFNTGDAQVLIGQIINKMPGFNFKDFSVVISSFYSFPDDLGVWGTGYKGLAYVNNGRIYLSNVENPEMGENSYVSVLAKFPLNTFKTDYVDNRYENFENVKSAFMEGTFVYKDSLIKRILSIVLPIAGFLGITGLIIYFARLYGYGYKDNKKINKKETPAFRDIPCNKDIFYANSLIKLNNFNYKETNIFGAVILKWVKEDKVRFIKEEKNGLFKNKESYSIDLSSNPTFQNKAEQKIFDMMYEASGDGILESNELKKWARIHASEFMNTFKKVEEMGIDKLKEEKHIYKRTSKSECKSKNVMDDMMYEDSKRLLGLKIFLDEFSNIKERETIEVKLWDEYLMFAYLFGIADKVFDQLKKLYPEVIQENMDTYNSVLMAQTFSRDTINSAVAAARSYSAGGGGFSTGGGGGGGFGGGISGGR